MQASRALFTVLKDAAYLILTTMGKYPYFSNLYYYSNNGIL